MPESKTLSSALIDEDMKEYPQRLFAAVVNTAYTGPPTTEDMPAMVFHVAIVELLSPGKGFHECKSVPDDGADFRTGREARPVDLFGGRGLARVAGYARMVFRERLRVRPPYYLTAVIQYVFTVRAAAEAGTAGEEAPTTATTVVAVVHRVVDARRTAAPKLAVTRVLLEPAGGRKQPLGEAPLFPRRRRALLVIDGAEGMCNCTSPCVHFFSTLFDGGCGHG